MRVLQGEEAYVVREGDEKLTIKEGLALYREHRLFLHERYRGTFMGHLWPDCPSGKELTAWRTGAERALVYIGGGAEPEIWARQLPTEYYDDYERAHGCFPHGHEASAWLEGYYTVLRKGSD